jgi:GTPase SAR1 family protein
MKRNSSQHADVNVNKILIGNKCDMQSDRAVSTEEGQALATEYHIRFFETSAKQDINVESVWSLRCGYAVNSSYRYVPATGVPNNCTRG